MNLPPLYPARLLRRYQRFLADLQLADGRQLTAHVPNTGSMRQCAEPGSAVAYSLVDNPRRKYAATLELVQVAGAWVDINTQRSNRVVEEALRAGWLADLAGFRVLPEQRLGASRLDFLLQGTGGPVWLEVKNVTLMSTPVCAGFPDAVSERGRRHLLELMAARQQGQRAVLLFLVQRPEARLFAPAADIDPAYARQFEAALQAGVEVQVWQTAVTGDKLPCQVQIVRRLPFIV
ncbi:MAG: DNA/RNA nuclease SfsA [Desulfuromonas thiophila]|nr:DNA/RNA nuclease SfsA [Desulfuromonas thiophila]